MTEPTNHDLAMKAIKRKQLKGDLRSLLESSIDQRIDRYLEVNQQWITGDHYFTPASIECIELYRDGYFISAVMASQAVNEGILKFVAERNAIKKKSDKVTRKGIFKFVNAIKRAFHKENESHKEIVEELTHKKTISKECAEASMRIWGSFRNDVHHMNPKVATIPFETLAKRNLIDLSIIERDIFGVDIGKDGGLIPHHPKYWDIEPNGTMRAFLRIRK